MQQADGRRILPVLPAVTTTDERVGVAGVPTEEHTILENLDLMMHPMRVHFNDALLTNLWVRVLQRTTTVLTSHKMSEVHTESSRRACVKSIDILRLQHQQSRAHSQRRALLSAEQALL